MRVVTSREVKVWMLLLLSFHYLEVILYACQTLNLAHLRGLYLRRLHQTPIASTSYDLKKAFLLFNFRRLALAV